MGGIEKINSGKHCPNPCFQLLRLHHQSALASDGSDTQPITFSPSISNAIAAGQVKQCAVVTFVAFDPCLHLPASERQWHVEQLSIEVSQCPPIQNGPADLKPADLKPVDVKPPVYIKYSKPAFSADSYDLDIEVESKQSDERKDVEQMVEPISAHHTVERKEAGPVVESIRTQPTKSRPSIIRRVEQDSEEGELSDDEQPMITDNIVKAVDGESNTRRASPTHEIDAATADQPMHDDNMLADGRQDDEYEFSVIDLTVDDIERVVQERTQLRRDLKDVTEQLHMRLADLRQLSRDREHERDDADRQQRRIDTAERLLERERQSHRTERRRMREQLEIAEQQAQRERGRAINFKNTSNKLSIRIQALSDELYNAQAQLQSEQIQHSETVNKLQLLLSQKENECQETAKQRDGLTYVAEQLRQAQEQLNEWHNERASAIRELAQMTAKCLNANEEIETQQQSRRQIDVQLHETTRQRDHLHAQLASQGRLQQSYLHSHELVTQFRDLSKRKDELVGQTLGLKREFAEEQRRASVTLVGLLNVRRLAGFRIGASIPARHLEPFGVEVAAIERPPNEFEIVVNLEHA